ncbi:MAG: DNA repair protein RecN, partial [Ectothiorhodospiraceae bacterium]
MLRHIHIRDFAIVDAVDVDFEGGMTALTGETGAGKSILLDALGLCLGDRADSGAVPERADRAEVNVSFDVTDNRSATDWLEGQSLDADGDCVLRRVVQRNGRSQAWINGRPVPLQLLGELGNHLVDIHGQHAHQSLMRTDAQREALDAYANHDGQLQQVRELHGECRRLRNEIRRLEGGQESYEDRLELLRFQVKELEDIGLNAEEIRDLDQEQRRLAGAGETLEACQAVLSSLYDDEHSAQSALSSAIRRLDDRVDLDTAIGGAHELFNNALVQLEEGCNSLRHYVDAVELDPARLQWVEEQIQLLNDLARKHRVRPEELPGRLAELQGELAELEQAEERLDALTDQLAQCQNDYRAAATELSYSRQRAAVDLGDKVTALMHELGMPGGELGIRVALAPEGKITSHGLDDVRFEVRTNPDQRFAPLNKVASGGELSRIGLAMEVAAAGTTHIPTLIFDEADTGIGGAVAEVVGRKLRELGGYHQVLCVTHLPQVAAQAHHQLKVEKDTAAGRTRTDIASLDTDARTQEIARMLGGVEITENTLNHAR